MTSKTPLLDRVVTPAQLRQLDPSDLRQLADELRQETIDAVSVTGGHLGAGLGVVELTLAEREDGRTLRVVREPARGLVLAREAARVASRGDVLAYVDADCRPPITWLAQVEQRVRWRQAVHALKPLAV